MNVLDIEEDWASVYFDVICSFVYRMTRTYVLNV